MNSEQALNFLYQSARRAPLTADEHDTALKAARVLQEALKENEPVDSKKKK